MCEGMCSTLSPEAFFHLLRSRRGLYLLGAGASAGEAPFGARLLPGLSIDFLQHAPSYPVSRPDQSRLIRRLRKESQHLTAFEVWRRELRPGTDDPTQQLLQRISPNFICSSLMNQFARPLYCGRVSHNYLPFRFAPPSLFMNYNHDGLASNLIGDIHHVIPVHGSVDWWIGAPEALKFIRTASIAYDLAVARDELLLLEPESYFDHGLARRLLSMTRCKPEFIAIIGYSFGWTGEHHDDDVSFDCLVDHFRNYTGPVIVVDPHPERLQEILAERLHGTRVIALRAYWNLLAHAFLEALAGRLHGRALNDYCAQLYDSGLGDKAYPLVSEQA
jgi:hypothetical protein